MALIKSAKKAHKRSLKLAERNLKVKQAMKSSLRSLRQIVAKGETVSSDVLSSVYSIIDKAAKINVIHRKNAFRKKSRITKLVNKQVAA